MGGKGTVGKPADKVRATGKKTKAAADAKTPEERSSFAKKGVANTDYEQRRRNLLATTTAEERSNRAKHGWGSKTSEERAEMSRKISATVKRTNAARTPAERLALSKKAAQAHWAGKTPEDWTEMAKQAWVKRRLNQGLASAVSSAPEGSTGSGSLPS